MGIHSSPGYLAAVCLLAATIYGASAASRHFEIEPRNAIVFPGQNVTIMCRLGVPLQYCRIKLPSLENALSLSEKTKQTSSEFAYFGSGLNSGQCGVTLFNIQEKFNGEVSCAGTGEEDSEESKSTTTLTVARTPKGPELIVSPSASSRGSNDYREGEYLHASCIVRDARPVANITWFLGNDILTSGEEGIQNVVDADERSMLFTTKQNITRKLSWKDNNRDLRCVVGHVSLGPKNQTGKMFSVRYAPRDIQMPIEQFGFTLGETGHVVVDVLANPRPLLTWIIGRTELSEGDRDKTGKLEAMQGEFIKANESDGFSQGQDKWRAKLYISDITKEDVARDYYLKAKNSEGEKKYRVVISTLTETQAMILGPGGIIGIVAAVLILLLIIILIIFARATGRWCFAGGVPAKHDPRETSDTESAENGTLEKKKKKNKTFMAHFFKKKNDKVAADPEEVKTIPTEDEKDISKEDGDNSLSDSKKDVVYAELDLQLNRSPVIIREDEKTEYAEIIHSKAENSP